jgi:predicted SnoaL-like aldol condensation-catalyzing enzyme
MVLRQEAQMSNKELVLAAYEAVFNRKDASAIDRYYGPTYIQHNPQAPDGAEGIKGFVAALPPALSYEPGLVLEDGDLVMVQGRVRGFGPTPSIRVDIVRLEDGRIVEHWDVSQEEVEPTASGHPMFTPRPGSV